MPNGSLMRPPWCAEHSTAYEWQDGSQSLDYAPGFRPLGWVCPCDPGHPAGTTRNALPAVTAIGCLFGIIAGGLVALLLGIYGLLVAVAAGLARVGYEVWRLRRG